MHVLEFLSKFYALLCNFAENRGPKSRLDRYRSAVPRAAIRQMICLLMFVLIVFSLEIVIILVSVNSTVGQLSLYFMLFL